MSGNTHEFKEGDKVEYVGNMTRNLQGKKGVVTEIKRGRVQILWEDRKRPTGRYFPHNLKLIHVNIVPEELFEL